MAVYCNYKVTRLQTAFHRRAVKENLARKGTAFSSYAKLLLVFIANIHKAYAHPAVGNLSLADELVDGSLYVVDRNGKSKALAAT